MPRLNVVEGRRAVGTCRNDVSAACAKKTARGGSDGLGGSPAFPRADPGDYQAPLAAGVVAMPVAGNVHRPHTQTPFALNT